MAAIVVMLIHTHFHAATGWHIFRLSPLALRHSLSTALPLLNTIYTRTILQLLVNVKLFFKIIWKYFQLFFCYILLFFFTIFNSPSQDHAPLRRCQNSHYF
jgi:hypothetical protein